MYKISLLLLVLVFFSCVSVNVKPLPSEKLADSVTWAKNYIANYNVLNELEESNIVRNDLGYTFTFYIKKEDCKRSEVGTTEKRLHLTVYMYSFIVINQELWTFTEEGAIVEQALYYDENADKICDRVIHNVISNLKGITFIEQTNEISTPNGSVKFQELLNEIVEFNKSKNYVL